MKTIRATVMNDANLLIAAGHAGELTALRAANEFARRTALSLFDAVRNAQNAAFAAAHGSAQELAALEWLDRAIDQFDAWNDA